VARDVELRIGARGTEDKTVSVSVPDGEPEPWQRGAALESVGRDHARVDALLKVTGRARYTADVRRPGMLHAAVFRCPHPAASCKGIQAEDLRARPGVKAAWVADKQSFRYQGEEVAAVAAETLQQARDAIAGLDSSMEARPAVWDCTEAAKDGAPTVFDDRPNAVKPGVREKGDVEAAMATEGAAIVDMEFRTRVQTHSCLETHGVVCEWRDGDLHCWASTQGVMAVREGLAHSLDLPASQVHVICEHMGGGFGSKLGPVPFGVIAAELSREAGRPVRLMLDRTEEHLATGNRPDAVIHIRGAAAKDGTLLAIDHRGYGSPGAGRGAGTGRAVENIYAPQARRVSDQDVRTHTGPAAPMRAPGHPQALFAYEQVIDELAHRIGMDPVVFRTRNDDHPFRPAQFEEGARRIGWANRTPPGSGRGPVKSGLGCSGSIWYDFSGPGAVVTVRVSPDASVEVICGTQDIGTGTRTVMAVVAGEELGLPPGDLRIRTGHSDDPLGPQSGGSITTPTLSPAVRTAAYRARVKLAPLAARLLDAPEDEVAPHGGRWQVVGAPERSVPFAEVAAALGATPLEVQGERLFRFAGLDSRIAGCQFAVVDVDTETGSIAVRRVVAVHDCGRVLSPLTARSQINGGVIQGISYALFEERVLDPNDGRMLNANLEQYKIAGARDVPEIDIVLWDAEPGFTNTGAMGLGEPPVIPTAAAVANAVYNATGVRVRELPMTPMRVLAALDAARKEASRA
jgi:xanthine dehydrogenase YagR molybdenum-binding subunit